MKFHRLKLKNLNSLHGSQQIDFAEDLGDAPLFLIRGPTGSGKTTILDAICMALFGTTPRLREISKTRDRCARILTRGKGEAKIELHFSIADGQERIYYRANWNFRRAHGRPDGNPQDPRRSLHIVTADGEEIGAPMVNTTTQSEYDDVFSEVLRGLTVDDFLRSVMLAQNDFAAFLKAGVEEKASILERLTRTDKYRRIGYIAAERWSEKKNELQDLEKELETRQTDLPDEEEVSQWNEELQKLEEKDKELGEKLHTTQRKRDWLREEQRLSKELKEATSEKRDAEKKRDDADDDFQRLKRADAVEPGRSNLEAVDRLKKELQSIDKAHVDLKKQAWDYEKELENAKNSREKFQETLETAQKAKKEAQPILREARKLKTELTEKQKNLESAQSDLKTRRDQLKETQSALDDAQAAEAGKKEALEEAKKELEELDSAAGLVESFSGLQARVEQFVSAVKQSIEGQKKLAALNEDIEKRAHALEGLRKDFDAKVEAIKPLKKLRDEAQKTLQEQLGDAAKPRLKRKELGDRRDILGDELKAIEDCRKHVEARAQKIEERDQRKESIKKMTEEKKSLEKQLHKKKEEKEKLLTERKSLRAAQSELEVEQRLDDIRQHLEANDGDACPVCGSQKHPIFEDADATSIHQRVETKLKSLRDDMAALDKKLEKLNATIESFDTDLTVLNTNLDNQIEALGADQTAIDDLEREIEESAGNITAKDADKLIATAEPISLLNEIERERQEEFSTIKEKREELEDAVESLKTRDEKLEDASKELQELEREIDSKSTAIASDTKRFDEQRKDLDEKRSALVETAAKIRAEFAEFSINIEAEEDLEHQQKHLQTGLEEANKKCDAYKTLRDRRDKLKKEHREAAQSKQGLTEKLKSSQKEEKKSEKNAQEISKKVDKVSNSLDELLGDKDLDEWEQALEKDEEGAQKALNSARKKENEAQSTLTAAKQAIESNRESAAKTQDELKVARSELQSMLDKIGLADPEELRDALMDPKELKTLRESCAEKKSALQTAKKIYEECSKKQQEHKTNRPEDLEDDAGLEALQEQIESLKSERKTLQTELGKLTEKIDEAEKKEKNLSKTKNQLEEARRTAAPWKQLHDLIGRANGKHFKLFAQSLNLGEIITQANHHLATLVDRYRLAVKLDDNGFPTLDFEIIDRYHAGQRRSLVTLSGGETFLVSLALSLALADNRRLDLPIETIFLDEGFGTLDREALKTAMDCLNQLHYRGGRTVGVISHVEALAREGGIPHQIVLETVRDGVSRIRIA